MTPDALWRRYGAIWSLDAEARGGELAACLSEDVTYCDPNGPIEGQAALSAYIGGFQQGAPDAAFHIRTVLHHHGRTISHWTLQGPDGVALQTGTSFSLLADDGRFQAINGFFHAPGGDELQ